MSRAFARDIFVLMQLLFGNKTLVKPDVQRINHMTRNVFLGERTLFRSATRPIIRSQVSRFCLAISYAERMKGNVCDASVSLLFLPSVLLTICQINCASRYLKITEICMVCKGILIEMLSDNVNFASRPCTPHFTHYFNSLNCAGSVNSSYCRFN